MYLLCRVHEIAYGFGGPSEKNVSPRYFSIAKYQFCVSPQLNLPKFCWSCLTGLTHFANSAFGRNCIGGAMVRVLASSAVDRGFEPRLGKTKDYKIGTNKWICCFAAQHAALSRKSKDCWFGIGISV